MDGMHLDMTLKLVSAFGMPGMFFIVWYFSEKSHERTLMAYREDGLKMHLEFRQQIMELQLRSDEQVAEIRGMYEKNVELVKRYTELASSFRDMALELKAVIVLNTQTLTRVCDDVNKNQYCPQVRLRKDATGVLA
jgi:hypothetical protein